MAVLTNFLKLLKPEKNDYVDVDKHISENYDKIDSKMQELNTSNSGKLDKGAVSSEYDTAKKIEDKIKEAKKIADNAITPDIYYGVSDFRHKNTAYNVGDKVECMFNFELFLECIQGGTTSGNPLDTRNVVHNQQLTDGTVKWIVRTHVTNEMVDKKLNKGNVPEKYNTAEKIGNEIDGKVSKKVTRGNAGEYTQNDIGWHWNPHDIPLLGSLLHSPHDYGNDYWTQLMISHRGQGVMYRYKDESQSPVISPIYKIYTEENCFYATELAGAIKNGYIQDSGQKTKNKCYLDKVTKQPYRCLENTTDTSVTTKFELITNLEIVNKIGKRTKELFNGSHIANTQEYKPLCKVDSVYTQIIIKCFNNNNKTDADGNTFIIPNIENIEFFNLTFTSTNNVQERFDFKIQQETLYCKQASAGFTTDNNGISKVIGIY